jgi:CHASE3 domain sensor protein
MSVPIFWRIILGYSVILLLSVGVACYSIVQLGGLSGTARAALDTDNRMIAYEEILTDAFLSEVRYAGRFLINQNGAIHNEFRQFKEDFTRYMKELTALAGSDDIKARLLRVDELHLRYNDLFEQEARYINAGQPYAQSRYQQEREKILDATMRELERLKAQLNKDLQDKLQTMESAASAARGISIASTLVLVGLGVALSWRISNSITRPLSELTCRTAQLSGIESDLDLQLSRVPEIRALSDTLIQETSRLRETARLQASFVEQVGEQLAAPLSSVRQRLDRLSVASEQRVGLEIITREIDRLVTHCDRLRTSRVTAFEVKEEAPHPLAPVSPGKTSEINRWQMFLRRASKVVKYLAHRAPPPPQPGSPWLKVSWFLKTLIRKANKHE